ncbi:hypothetical protein KEM52_003972 [Ascosphaera acerosa]|nr:hypothetical protein KEM52_003972 [Ascosphaera acerosa]
MAGYPNFPAVERLTIKGARGVTWKGIVAALSAAPPQQQPQSDQQPGQGLGPGQPPPGMKMPPTAQRPAQRLLEMRLENTGVEPFAVALIFRHLPKIQVFEICQEDVTKPFPLDAGAGAGVGGPNGSSAAEHSLPIPPLFSTTLRKLRYEITSPPTPAAGIIPASETYFAYLVSSIMAKGLPALRELYVSDNKFPNALLTAPALALPGLLSHANPRMSLLPPPTPSSGGGFGLGVGVGVPGDRSSKASLFSIRGGDRTSLNMTANPDPIVRHTLAIYSKDPDELEWNLTRYDPRAAQGSRASATRPVSFFGAQLGPAWGGEQRQSVLVGNGFGGYLAIPAEEAPTPLAAEFRQEASHE